MMKMIGFVYLDDVIRITGRQIAQLPVGFTEEGRETDNWQETALILVDTENYSENEVRCTNGDPDVLLAQHEKDTEEHRNAQREWVINMEWEPREMPYLFNHVPGNEFMQIIGRI